MDDLFPQKNTDKIPDTFHKSGFVAYGLNMQVSETVSREPQKTSIIIRWDMVWSEGHTSASVD